MVTFLVPKPSILKSQLVTHPLRSRVSILIPKMIYFTRSSERCVDFLWFGDAKRRRIFICVCVVCYPKVSIGACSMYVCIYKWLQPIFQLARCWSMCVNTGAHEFLFTSFTCAFFYGNKNTEINGNEYTYARMCTTRVYLQVHKY